MHICSFIYDEEPKRRHSTDALVRYEDPFTFLRKQTYPNSVCLFTGTLSLTLFVSREKKGECCVLIFVLCIVVSKVLNSLKLMPLNLLYELILMLILWILWV